MHRAVPPLAVAAIAVWTAAIVSLAGGDTESDGGGVVEAQAVETAPPALAAQSRWLAERTTPPEDGATPAETAASAKPASRRIALRVSIVDGDSGTAIGAASWRVVQAADDDAVQKANAEIPFVQAHQSVDVVVRADAEFQDWRLDVAPPGGSDGSWILWSEPPRRPCIARYATSLVATAPLQPEARFAVAVVGSDGTPALAASMSGSVGVYPTSVDLRPRDFVAGVFRPRGVPFVRGARWSACVSTSSADGSRSARVEGSFRGRIEDVVRVALTLPPDPDPERRWRCGGCQCCCCCGDVDPVSEDAPVGDLSVVVRRRDGSLAAGAAVVFAPEWLPSEDTASPSEVELVRRLAEIAEERHADAAGRATCRSLAPGRYVVTLKEPGLVPTRVTAEVAADTAREIELVESRGAGIDLLVVDSDGDPIPFARIGITQPSGVAWLDVGDDGAQRLDMLVDARGRRLFSHLESGVVEVRASLGCHHVSRTAHLSEGVTERVVLALD